MSSGIKDARRVRIPDALREFFRPLEQFGIRPSDVRERPELRLSDALVEGRVGEEKFSPAVRETLERIAEGRMDSDRPPSGKGRLSIAGHLTPEGARTLQEMRRRGLRGADISPHPFSVVDISTGDPVWQTTRGPVSGHKRGQRQLSLSSAGNAGSIEPRRFRPEDMENITLENISERGGVAITDPVIEKALQDNLQRVKPGIYTEERDGGKIVYFRGYKPGVREPLDQTARDRVIAFFGEANKEIKRRVIDGEEKMVVVLRKRVGSVEIGRDIIQKAADAGIDNVSIEIRNNGHQNSFFVTIGGEGFRDADLFKVIHTERESHIPEVEAVESFTRRGRGEERPAVAAGYRDGIFYRFNVARGGISLIQYDHFGRKRRLYHSLRNGGRLTKSDRSRLADLRTESDIEIIEISSERMKEMMSRRGMIEFSSGRYGDESFVESMITDGITLVERLNSNSSLNASDRDTILGLLEFRNFIGVENLEGRFKRYRGNKDRLLIKMGAFGRRLQQINVDKDVVIEILDAKGSMPLDQRLENCMTYASHSEFSGLVGREGIIKLSTIRNFNPYQAIDMIFSARDSGLFDIRSTRWLIDQIYRRGRDAAYEFLKLEEYKDDLAEMSAGKRDRLFDLVNTPATLLEKAKGIGLCAKELTDLIVAIENRNHTGIEAFFVRHGFERDNVHLVVNYIIRIAGEDSGTIFNRDLTNRVYRTSIALDIADMNIREARYIIEKTERSGIEGSYETVTEFKTYIDLLRESSLSLSFYEMTRLFEERIMREVRASQEDLLGAVSAGEQFDAAVFRMRALRDWFGIEELLPPNISDNALAVTQLDQNISVRFEYGVHEARCGFQFSIYYSLNGEPVRLGTIGFQETANTIDIVRLQGSPFKTRETDQMLGDFREFSGGVDPLPWLAYSAGRHLLGRAEKEGKKLRWINGVYIRSGYPHYPMEPSEWVTNIDEAGRFWRKPNEELEMLAAQYYELLEIAFEVATQKGLVVIPKEGSPERPFRKAIFEDERLRSDEDLQPIVSRLDRLRLPVLMYRRSRHVEQIYNTTGRQLRFNSNRDRPFREFKRNSGEFGTGIMPKDDALREDFRTSVVRFDHDLDRVKIIDSTGSGRYKFGWWKEDGTTREDGELFRNEFPVPGELDFRR